MDRSRESVGLGSVPSVTIKLSKRRACCKFILAEISSGSAKRLVVRASEEYGYHRELHRNLLREVEGTNLSVKCLGGGFIGVSEKAKKIRIWDVSMDYGIEPREETVRLLSESYPEYSVVRGD